MNRPILCLDFDGVIHSYTSGWRGAHFIPDPPVPGAMVFLVEAVKHFNVMIFSSRSHQVGGVAAMTSYIDYHLSKEYGWDKGADAVAAANSVRNTVTYPTEKPPAMITIDDRALTFTGSWPSMEELKAFKPWNKRPPPMPGRYRAHPIEIEAWQYTGSPELTGVCICPECAADHVHTMHDGQIVALEIGDWIVPEPVPNRFYPIKPDVFAKKYEPT